MTFRYYQYGRRNYDITLSESDEKFITINHMDEDDIRKARIKVEEEKADRALSIAKEEADRTNALAKEEAERKHTIATEEARR
jgi:hypothetical protein